MNEDKEETITISREYVLELLLAEERIKSSKTMLELSYSLFELVQIRIKEIVTENGKYEITQSINKQTGEIKRKKVILLSEKEIDLPPEL